MARCLTSFPTVRDPEPIANPNFAAVLLAGGRSSRMGCDKAGLVIDGLPLWQRQLAKLRALEPRELFISGRPAGPYAGAGMEVLADAEPGLGPLSGIAAALRRAESPLILVLAIDLPAMTSAFLAKVVRRGRSVVPRNARFFEPLAAVYPKSALALAEEHLRSEDRSLQRFIRRLIEAGLTEESVIDEADLPCFQNVNEVRDLA